MPVAHPPSAPFVPVADDTFDLPLPPDEVLDTPIFWTACGRGLACVCSVAGGGAASHAGCVVSPTIAFAGVAGGASVSMVAAVISTALTGAGLALWYKLRGQAAGPLEKRLTVGGAMAGAVMSLGMNFIGVGAHHDMRAVDAALVTYRGLPENVQATMRQNARDMGRSLSDYALSTCIPVPNAPAFSVRPGANYSFPRLDKP